MKFKIPNSVKTFLEFLPLIIFFIAYKFYQDDIIIATKYLMISSVISLTFIYLFEKSVPKPMLYSTILIVACGIPTIVTNNSTFIKMKPTLLYLLFGCILLIGLLNKKLFLKNILDKAIKMPDEDWNIFTKRWVYFFFSLAAINELIWRNFSENAWINFKLIGLPICIILFLLINIPFLMKHIDHKK